MSRFDGRFDAAAEVQLDSAAVAAALDLPADRKSRERKEAIACFLTASEGWEEAAALLGGAFAPEQPNRRTGEE